MFNCIAPLPNTLVQLDTIGRFNVKISQVLHVAAAVV
jgi:hypothetical protein